MRIFEKVLNLLKQNRLCPYCVGRMFSLLGTNTTNLERANSLYLSLTMENHKLYLSGDKNNRDLAIKNLKILAEQANYIPAQKILEKEGFGFSEELAKENCYLCQAIFDNLNFYVGEAIKKINNLEFKNILVGTSPRPAILNKEDKFKSEYTILEAESFKSHFNREVGKLISERLNKPAKFEKPDLTVIFSIDYDNCQVELLIRSLFIYGRYKKFIRGIPQTRWPCGNCQGKGCEECNFSGKQYPTSVEELISPPFVKATNAKDSKFHGAGREDIDVRMMGTGRPFVLELIKPQIRDINLEKLKRKVNQNNEGKIEILKLRFSNKDEVISIKENAEYSKKKYKALVEAENEITEDEFKEFLSKLKYNIEGSEIKQKTPQRVAHRRADKTREKKIYQVKGKYLKPRLFEFSIKTQGGTYIKELISGDEGRTVPSFSSIFQQHLITKNLDVIEIEYK